MIDALGALTDVPGISVGHARRVGRGWRTGTTVVLAAQGAVAGVDVRGGGPGTRETDALSPLTLIDQVHAVCLSGGSAFGLAAAHGVVEWLEERRLGVRVGDADDWVVPVVPAAVIFDLGRGGRFGARPDAEFGRRAASGASTRRVGRGAVGAGTGAVAGGLQGGIGTSSALVQLEDGLDPVVVGALAVVNAAGSVIDPSSGLPWYPPPSGFRRPSAAERGALRRARQPPSGSLNTTIGVIATSAALTVAEATKLASVGHDGLARAVRPAHSMFDGDTLFALATGHHQLVPADRGAPTAAGEFRRAGTRPAALNQILETGAHCFALACSDAVLSASSHRGDPSAPAPPSYRDLAPGAYRPNRDR